jgi:sulfate adenylyltransferase subunit 2
MLYAYRPGQQLLPGEQIQTDTVRYRTVGDMSCTGGTRSNATTINQIIKEITTTRITERGETRADDKTSDAAMEERKQAGYF